MLLLLLLAAEPTPTLSKAIAVKKPPIVPQLALWAEQAEATVVDKETMSGLKAYANDRSKHWSMRTAAKILLADQAFLRGDVTAGKKTYAALLKESRGRLDDYLGLRLGKRLLIAKQAKAAIEALRPVDKRVYRGSRQRQARLLLAKAYLAAERFDDAATAFRNFQRVCGRCMLGQRPDVLLVEAKLAWAAGKKALAKGLLVRIFDHYPKHPDSAEAGLLLQKYFPSLPMTLDRKLRAIRARAPRMGDRWAVGEFRALAKRYEKRPDLLFEVQLNLGRQLRRVDPAEGAALLDRLTQEQADKPGRITRIQGAKRLVLPRLGRMDEVVDLYFEQAWTTSDPNYRMERLFYTAWSLFGGGRYKDAAELFAWLVNQRRVSRDHKRMARWFGPWARFRSGDYEGAIEAFEKVAKQRPAMAAAATFWSGRAEILRGQPEAGMAKFQKLRERWPWTLYGLRVASLDVAEERAPRRRRDDWPKSRLTGRKSTLDRLALFANLADERWGRAECLRGGLPVDPAIATAWGQALTSAGAVHPAFQVAHHALQYVAGLPGAQHRPLWELAFPRPYLERCIGCAEVEQIPTALIYAIMREESQFRPAVLSPAEAVGLMQIIPPTARLIVQTAKKTKLDPEALDDPDHNIAMGAWYLAGLSERYSHQFPQVMAAYNAGPNAADQWVRRAGRFQMDQDMFMEEVPYKETRGYVKRVSRSLAVYRMLYGLEPGRFSPVVQGLVLNQISGDLSF
ncbi:MAG: hypothetical protein CMH50_13650 [Myxococcales bacterium]|nr:hypothetical protein [Myxococcales bacterium]